MYNNVIPRNNRKMLCPRLSKEEKENTYSIIINNIIDGVKNENNQYEYAYAS